MKKPLNPGDPVVHSAQRMRELAADLVVSRKVLNQFDRLRLYSPGDYKSVQDFIVRVEKEIIEQLGEEMNTIYNNRTL